MKFGIDTEGIRYCERGLVQISEEVSNVVKLLSEITSDLGTLGSRYSGIKINLHMLETALMNEEKMCRKLAETLSRSRKIYIDTENNLVDGYKNIERFADVLADESGDDGDSLLENLANALLGAVLGIGATGIVDVNIVQELRDLSNKQVLYLLELLEHSPSSVVIEAQYELNKQEWEKYKENYMKKSIYIEEQSALTSMGYGTANKFEEYLFFNDHEMTAADNACEVIAVYNALAFLEDGNPQVDFPELLRDFSKDGIVLGGVWGTSPDSLQEYMDALGYDTKMLYGNDINEGALSVTEKRYDTYILTAYNQAGDITRGIHTVSITCEEDGKYYIHNNGLTEENDSTGSNINEDERYSNLKPFDSLYDAVNGFNHGKGDAICVIGIK